jgi:hypothetical protein
MVLVNGILLVEVDFKELIVDCALKILVPISSKYAAFPLFHIKRSLNLRIEFLEIPSDQILLGYLQKTASISTCFGRRDKVSFGLDSTIVHLLHKLDCVWGQIIGTMKE